MGTPWPIWAWAMWGGAALAVVLACLCLFRFVRPRRRPSARACPKCQYDMTGVPGLLCPECGASATSELAFARPRRRRRLVAAGACFLTCGVVLALWPSARLHGWWTVTPDIVLIAMWPDRLPGANTPSPVTAPPQSGRNPGRSPGFMYSRTQGTTTLDEVTRAIAPANLWWFERRALDRRCAKVLASNADLIAFSAAQRLARELGDDAVTSAPFVIPWLLRDARPGYLAEVRASFSQIVRLLPYAERARADIESYIKNNPTPVPWLALWLRFVQLELDGTPDAFRSDLAAALADSTDPGAADPRHEALVIIARFPDRFAGFTPRVAALTSDWAPIVRFQAFDTLSVLARHSPEAAAALKRVSEEGPDDIREAAAAKALNDLTAEQRRALGLKP